MPYKILNLSALLSLLSEGDVTKVLLSYNPANGLEHDDFLVNKAIMMEKKQECRTYIAVDTESYDILGYFSLAMRCLEIPDDCGLSNSMLKKINRSEEKVSQAYLLGQLSRCKHMKGFGKVLLNEAMARIKEANAIIGCKLVRIDCDDRLVQYYEGLGFFWVKKNDDKDLNQMITII